jgi:hypothetical protein
MTLSITALCHHVEYHYAECRILFVFMLNDVFMLNAIMLSVVAPFTNDLPIQTQKLLNLELYELYFLNKDK